MLLGNFAEDALCCIVVLCFVVLCCVVSSFRICEGLVQMHSDPLYKQYTYTVDWGNASVDLLQDATVFSAIFE